MSFVFYLKKKLHYDTDYRLFINFIKTKAILIVSVYLMILIVLMLYTRLLSGFVNCDVKRCN